jgi:hypothetical protein
MRWEDVLNADGSFSTEVPAVSDLLKALCEPGYPGELAGQSAAVAAFSAAREKALLSEKSPRRPLRTRARGAKLAAAAVVGSLVMGGVAAAAVTGSLPGPVQDVAHTLGLPSAGGDPTESDSPDASGSADPSTPGSAGPSAGGQQGNGPSVFAVCWYVVHRTNGAAGGPGAVQPPTGQPNAAPNTAPTGGGTDSLDHGDGAWSQAYARIKAAAGGQSVLDYCTAQVAAAGKGGKGTKDGNSAAGNGKGKGNAPTATGTPKSHGNSGSNGHGNGGGSNGNGNSNGSSTSKGHGNSAGGHG